MSSKSSLKMVWVLFNDNNNNNNKREKKGGGGVQVNSDDLLPHEKEVKLQSRTELTQVVKEQ